MQWRPAQFCSLNQLFGLNSRFNYNFLISQAFKYIILQVNKDYDNDEPPNLPETFKGFSEIRRPSSSKTPDRLNFDVLKDLVIHLVDTAMTMRIFVEVCPKAVDIFRKTNFIIR